MTWFLAAAALTRAACPSWPLNTAAPSSIASAAAVASLSPNQTELAKIKRAFTDHVLDNSSATAASARAWAANLTAVGSWPDIDYTNECRGCWQAFEHVQRAGAMSQALAADAALLAPLASALGFWLSHDFTNPNWWCAGGRGKMTAPSRGIF